MERWNTNESLLQSYRSIFISSQSIMLAVGALLIDKDDIYIILISILSLIQIWYIWHRVIFSRAIIVDYYKYKMHNKYNDTGELINISNNETPLHWKTYVKNKSIRKKVNDNMKNDPDFNSEKEEIKFRNIRHTRLKLDFFLPISFTFIWIILLVVSLL